MDRRRLIACGLGAALLPRAGRTQARRPKLTLGVLTDFSGAYAGIAGQGSVACTRLAAREFAAHASPAFDIEVVSADHRNDPKRGAELAAHWFDAEGVDAIVDVPNSDVALAVSAVARQRNRVLIECGAGAADITHAACSPNTVAWGFDTTMLARSTGGAFTQAGGSTWFFVTADYAFGHQLEAETTRHVIAAGGRIEGAATYRFPGTTDFTPVLRQAQQSGAAVLGLANAGADVTACVRGAAAMGLTGQMRLACLLMQLPDVHRLGLDLAGGLILTESFYWDLNDRTRAFATRLAAQEKPPAYPDMIQASCYAGALHYLKAIGATDLAVAKRDGAAAVARMKAMPTDDDAFGRASIRQDGRALVPAYLFRVKTEGESSGEWDLYRLLTTTEPEDAYGPMSSCAMART